MFSAPFNLNRYLLVCKVNSATARLPIFPSPEFSVVLGTVIAERLPTVQARQWHKTLAVWDDYIKFFPAISGLGKKPKSDSPRSKAGARRRQDSREKPLLIPVPKKEALPESPWPLDAVLFFYPGKQIYGRDELIFWELKLTGESADHGLFLELILPALEEAGSVRDSRWNYTDSLWGRFDIHSVFMAKGTRWDPVVSRGRLNLKYKAGPRQWARGLKFESPRPPSHFDCLTWLTAFDLNRNDSGIGKSPSLRSILDALTDRLARLTLGSYYSFDDFWKLLRPKERSAFQNAVEMSSEISVFQEDIKTVPKYLPGRQIGKQIFREPLPDLVLPYLGLASVFHIGKHTHFGCGTFLLN